MWVRGLKQSWWQGVQGCRGSHPMWVRGLKHIMEGVTCHEKASHPMWVRGLKLNLYRDHDVEEQVAPHVGAWIETSKMNTKRHTERRRTPCGCVD